MLLTNLTQKLVRELQFPYKQEFSKISYLLNATLYQHTQNFARRWVNNFLYAKSDSQQCLHFKFLLIFGYIIERAVFYEI